jgi:hypothetical protein
MFLMRLTVAMCTLDTVEICLTYAKVDWIIKEHKQIKVLVCLKSTIPQLTKY